MDDLLPWWESENAEMLVEGGLRYPATFLALPHLPTPLRFLNEMARTQKGTKTVIISALECVCP